VRNAITLDGSPLASRRTVGRHVDALVGHRRTPLAPAPGAAEYALW
jgi:hypothetical protein